VARYCREIGIKIPDELASTELIVHRAQCRSGHDLVIHAARLHRRRDGKPSNLLRANVGWWQILLQKSVATFLVGDWL